MAMLALGIKPGDEVIVPAKTFISTANAVLYCGGTPVFCDVQERTMNMDPDSLKKALTKRTKAVVPVHLAGQPCDMDEITEICEPGSVTIVEDSAHSPYATYKGKCAGTFGKIGVFSFYPDKVLASADGGMVVTDDPETAEKIHLLRNCGRQALGDRHAALIGYNYRMNEFQAALGKCQLGMLDDMIWKRRKLAEHYDIELRGIPDVQTPYTAPDRTHDFYAYMIHVRDARRKRFQSKLAALGVETSIMFEPVYLQRPYVQLFGRRQGLCPVSESLSDEAVSIPLHAGLEPNDLDYVCDSIKKVVAS